jgi:hypothetical protein
MICYSKIELWCTFCRRPFSSIVFPSISWPRSRWNNSSHDTYQWNLSCQSVFSIDTKKCNRARIMISPLQRCQISFLSIADFSVHFFSTSSPPRDALQAYFYSTSCAGVTIHIGRTSVIMVIGAWFTKHCMYCWSLESILKGVLLAWIYSVWSLNYIRFWAHISCFPFKYSEHAPVSVRLDIIDMIW